MNPPPPPEQCSKTGNGNQSSSLACCIQHCHSHAAMYIVRMYENTRPDLHLNIWVLSCAICPKSRLYEYFSTTDRVWRCYQVVIRSRLTFSVNSAYVFPHYYTFVFLWYCKLYFLFCCVVFVLLHDVFSVFLCYQPVIRS